MPDVRLINIVDDSLLPDVMAEGKIGPAVIRRMCSYVVAAEATGADAVLSLCSSLGPSIDVARRLVSIPVIKIDEAMAEKAAREARRSGPFQSPGYVTLSKANGLVPRATRCFAALSMTITTTLKKPCQALYQS